MAYNYNIPIQYTSILGICNQSKESTIFLLGTSTITGKHFDPYHMIDMLTSTTNHKSTYICDGKHIKQMERALRKSNVFTYIHTTTL